MSNNKKHESWIAMVLLLAFSYALEIAVAVMLFAGLVAIILKMFGYGVNP